MKTSVIAQNTFFATPESMDVITDWIAKHPAEEQAHLYTVMGMTWNYLAKLTATEGSDDEV
jgi:hypothetical protein